MKRLILIGTYNERENIGLLLERLRTVVPTAEILIVDDRSPDGTGAIVREAAAKDPAIHLLERNGPKGYGRSMLDGFAWALEHGIERLVTMDADFSHEPDNVSDLLDALEDGADMALGSRYTDGVRVLNWEVSRLLLSISANRYVQVLLRLPYADCTSGFRSYRSEVLQTILKSRVNSRGYSFLVETLFWAHRKKYAIREVPIVYLERRRGQSKMSKSIIFESAMNPARLWTKWIFRRP